MLLDFVNTGCGYLFLCPFLSHSYYFGAAEAGHAQFKTDKSKIIIHCVCFTPDLETLYNIMQFSLHFNIFKLHR